MSGRKDAGGNPGWEEAGLKCLCHCGSEKVTVRAHTKDVGVNHRLWESSSSKAQK